MAEVNKDTLLVDIGSSSVKVYSLSSDGALTHLQTKSIAFKDNFTPEKGISKESRAALYSLVIALKHSHPDTEVHLYATALFRKFSPEASQEFKKDFVERTDTDFQVIGHDEENAYLEAALLGKYEPDFPVLLINIGGGSTELVVKKKGKTIDKTNLPIGVGTINTIFPLLNNEFSEVPLEEVISFVKKQFPASVPSATLAFYTGGELTYMKLAAYPLQKNTFFSDHDHPFMIPLTDFASKNREVFTQVSLQNLEKLMPDNPTWMHGARACSAFAQAICEVSEVESIIPSDANLVNGIVRRDFSII